MAVPAGALAHRGLAWLALLLAFVGWVLILSGVASLQQVGPQPKGVVGLRCRGPCTAAAAAPNRALCEHLSRLPCPLPLTAPAQACSGSMVTTLSDLAQISGQAAPAGGRRLLQAPPGGFPGIGGFPGTVGYLAPVPCKRFFRCWPGWGDGMGRLGGRLSMGRCRPQPTAARCSAPRPACSAFFYCPAPRSFVWWIWAFDLFVLIYLALGVGLPCWQHAAVPAQQCSSFRQA